MLRFLFDTNHLTLYQHADPTLLQHVQSYPSGSVGISAVTVEEALKGRLAKLARRLTGPVRIQAYANLVDTVQLFLQFSIVPFDQASEDQFQRLLGQRIRVGTRDLRIAAVALANNLTLLTQNQSDFKGIPGIMLDDWSK